MEQLKQDCDGRWNWYGEDGSCTPLQATPMYHEDTLIGYLFINPEAPSGDVRLVHPGWPNV